MSADVTYAPDRIGYRYGVPDTAYSKGYHRGQDVRKLNPQGTASVVTDVDAVDAGRVVYVGRPNDRLGLTVVIDTGRTRGRCESHSHMADVVVAVGQQVGSGQRLGRNAGMDENPGQVDGPHDHITVTDAFNGAWETWMDEYDPLPYIQAAYERTDDMGTLDNSEENYQTFARFLQRALKWDVRRDGYGADAKLGPSVFDMLGAADDSSDIKAIAVKMTDADRAAIAKAVADAIKLPAGGASKADVTAAVEAAFATLTLKAS